MSIKRLAIVNQPVGCVVGLDKQGDYVFYRDHVAEVERLESALKHWQDAFDRVQTKANTQEDKVLSMSADVHALEAEVERLLARVPNPDDLRIALVAAKLYCQQYTHSPPDAPVWESIGRLDRLRATLEEA